MGVVARQPGSAEWSETVALSRSGHIANPDVAVEPDGSVTVVWKRNASPESDDITSLIETARKPLTSSDFGDVEILSDEGFHFSPPRVAATCKGRVVVVWDNDLSETESRVVIADRRGPSFDYEEGEFVPQDDEDHESEVGRFCHPAITTNSDGSVIVTWNTTFCRHWRFFSEASPNYEWYGPGKVHCDASFGTAFLPDGRVLFPVWDQSWSDDEDAEDLGAAGMGEIMLHWQDPSLGNKKLDGGTLILQEEAVETPLVAVGDNGTVALVFKHWSTVKAAIWSPRRKSLNRVPDLISVVEDEDYPFDETMTQLVVSPDGTVTLVMFSFEANSVIAASKTPDSDGFDEPVQIRSCNGNIVRDLTTVIDDAGNITAVWWEGELFEDGSNHDKTGGAIMSLTWPAGEGDSANPVVLSRPNGAFSGLSLSLGVDGTTAAAWAATDQ